MTETMIELIAMQRKKVLEIADTIATIWGDPTMGPEIASYLMMWCLFPSHCGKCLATDKDHSPGWGD